MGPDGPSSDPQVFRFIHVRLFISACIATHLTPNWTFPILITDVLSTCGMPRDRLPKDKTLPTAQQRLQFGQITRVGYFPLFFGNELTRPPHPFPSMSVVGIPQAGDDDVSEYKKILKRCSSARPISMTRVEPEVFFLCYDSE